MLNKTFLVVSNPEDPLLAPLAQFWARQGGHCLAVTRLQEWCLSVAYDLGGAYLSLSDRGAPAPVVLHQQDIGGLWYRGLPELPPFADTSDRSYAERELQAFWEGYCKHTPSPVLNCPRTSGLRPVGWGGHLVRFLVRTHLGLPTPPDRLGLPDGAALAGHDRLCQSLADRRLLPPEEVVDGQENCVLLDVPSDTDQVVGLHVGKQVLLVRLKRGRPYGAPLTYPGPVDGLDLVQATCDVASLFREELGAAFFAVSSQAQALFLGYTPAPGDALLEGLSEYLFPMIWRYFSPR